MNKSQSIEHIKTLVSQCELKISAISTLIAEKPPIDISALTDYLMRLSECLEYIPYLISCSLEAYNISQGISAKEILEQNPNIKESVARALMKGMTAKYCASYESVLAAEKALMKRIDSVITTISAEKEVYKKNI